MPERSFVHLHCHSHYSLLDGANRIPELVQRTKDLGMNAIALTDHGNLYGAIELYRECKAAGINPIIGYEAYVAPTRRTERTGGKRGDAGFHLTLLAQNATGFKNLIKMSSIAFLEGYYYVPRIDKELLEAHSEGLICLSGCLSGEFNELIIKGEASRAVELAQWFHKVFGKNFYIEIQNNGLEMQDRCTTEAVAISTKLGVPLVATADAHYLCQQDWVAHDVLICINTGSKRSDEKRMHYGEGNRRPYFVQPPQGMYELFPNHADAVQRSQEIADSVHIELDFKKRHFPVFTPPAKKTPEDYLRELCAEGLLLRYGPEPKPEARARMELELNIICRMGFASYFLIVWDFVRFARENGIPASARGSGCGAVVSYVLQLSHVDPLQYDLLFERFLDPNRSEAPDIDIDFCQDRRELVIAYVKQKYGEQSVAQIATFGTLAAKASIKDVGRVLDIPLERVTFMTKWVSPKPGTTIEDTLRESPDFRREYESDPEVRRWIDIAMKLEGTNRNAGTHAAGVVIANGPITDYVPVHRVVRKGDDAGSKSGEAVVTTQWVMGDLEKVGLLKMDFLGLRTLTLVDNTLRLIKKTRGKDLDVYKDIPIDDAETYKLLQRGDAKGVFQFESDGIRELLKRMRPDNIRDIIACTALYRPGPLEGGMVDEYIDCKHGRKKPEYAHPIMEEVLSETYGVMVFQEEVMRILNRLGGIELSSAYACIKAISKKKYDIIDARRVDFVKGAQGRGLSEDKAKEIFDLIVKFGGYGFNKCVVGETKIMDARTGACMTVSDLFRSRRPFVIHALDAQSKLTPALVTDVVWNGRKPVFRVRTELGKEITATANHPFRTIKGWTNLEDLKPGERLAAAARSGIFWDRVVSIEPAGVQDTYDLTVDTHHNFVANGLIVHNSHSAAYAYVSYHTAYLKRHYTPEFMAALLSSEIEDGNKRDIMVEHFEDAKRLGYPVQPPNINTDHPDFTVVRSRILFGLVAIKGLGRGAAEEIVRARAEGGPFKDFFDLCERIDLKIVSRAALERLIKAGALDCFGAHRSQLMDALARAIQAAQEKQQDRKHGQGSLFETFDGGDAGASAAGEGLREVPEWAPTEKLKYEKEALDFYVSSHPLAQHETLIRLFSTHQLSEIGKLDPNQEVLIGCMLTQVRYMNTKKARNGNSRYLRCKLEDFSGSVECVMWPDDFVRCQDMVAEDRICFVQATVERAREEPSLVITRLQDMEQVQRERTTGLLVELSLDDRPEKIDRLARALKEAPGNCPVFLRITDGQGKHGLLKASQEFRINPVTLSKPRLEEIVGEGRVHFSRHGTSNGRNGH